MPVLILYNARIHTLNPEHPNASALAIENKRAGNRILAVGNDDEILAEFGGEKTSQNMDGKTILPGLTDSHIHLHYFALGLQKIDCEVSTKEECLARVAERARTTGPGNWIQGHGWNQNNWVDGFGTAADLDEVASQNPVYLTSKSLHTSWANTQALRLAHIGPDTPDPPDGVIQRDDHGNPTGILFEGAAGLVNRGIPEPTRPEILDLFLQAQTRLLQMGITAVHDFDGAVCFSVLQQLHAEGDLKIRVVKSIPFENLPHAIDLGLRSGFGDDWLRIGGVKIFSDGALGPHTAAMFQPYENDPNNRGMLLMDGEEIYEHGQLAIQNGLSLAVHAIGDRANHEALYAFERLREHESTLRHRIEHVQILHPEDSHRSAALGITASMQPIHATSDMRMADAYWGKRAATAYAWRTQLSHGATLAFGSDAPVESPNPFWGIHAAVTRRRVDGAPGPNGWYPAQRLTVREALAGFTAGAAYAAGMEDRLGKLAPGFLADLVVLDSDPLDCDLDEIRRIQPAATMVGGTWLVGSG